VHFTATTMFLLLALSLGTSPWQAGQVCEGINYTTTPAQDMLRGKHLRVLDLYWMPFAQPDADAPSGWSGMDVDLLNQVSWLLGFTFDIEDMGYPAEGASWTDHALEWQWHGDLMASFWVPQSDRRDNSIQLRGHLDLSTVLVARTETIETGTWTMDSVFSFLKPFELSLWLSFAVFVVLSGTVDFLVERSVEAGHRLSTCIYEYCAGLLWGGFEKPLTRMSAVYQVVTAFFLLIINASYTANLAAFITVNSAPGMTASSVDQMQADGGRLCMMPGGWQSRFDASFPRMTYLEVEGEASAAQALYDGGDCDAMVTPKNNYDGWRTDPGYCSFAIAEVLFAASGGWMTNPHSYCVQHAIEWALFQLESNGTVDRIYSSYMPLTPCAGESQEVTTLEETETVTERRRLNTRGERPSARSRTGPAASSREGRAGRPRRDAQHRGRRLETSGDADEASDSQVAAMATTDFIGIFLIWAFVTVMVLMPTTAKYIKEKWDAAARPQVAKLSDDSDTQDAAAGGSTDALVAAKEALARGAAAREAEEEREPEMGKSGRRRRSNQRIHANQSKDSETFV